MNKEVNFEIAKLLKEKGFDKSTLCFYTKPNSKMFGIDEHGRYYPIKNKAKSLWITGKAATLHIHNVYFAPTIAEVVMWLYEKYNVWVIVVPYNDEELSQTLWENKTIDIADDYNDSSDYTFYHSPTEAYEAGIKHVLENLIEIVKEKQNG